MTEFCIKLLVLTFKVTKEILIVQCVIEHSSVTRRYPVRLKMLLCFISFAGSPSEVHAEDQLQVSSNTVDQDRFGFFDHSKKKTLGKICFFSLFCLKFCFFFYCFLDVLLYSRSAYKRDTNF